MIRDHLSLGLSLKNSKVVFSKLGIHKKTIKNIYNRLLTPAPVTTMTPHNSPFFPIFQAQPVPGRFPASTPPLCLPAPRAQLPC